MNVFLNNTYPEAMFDEHSAEQALIKPATFDNKLICPVVFDHKPSEAETFDGELIKPAIFVTDSAKSSETSALHIVDNSNTSASHDACTPTSETQQSVSFVPGVLSSPLKKLLNFPLNDVGNVERFLAVHGEIVKYACNTKKFFVWNGIFWQADEKKIVKALCESAMRKYFYEAQPLQFSTNDFDQDIYAHARSSCNAGKINALMTMLQHHCAVLSYNFDTQPHLLNVRNGIVNLKTGQLLPHDKDLMLSKYIDVNFVPGKAYTNSVFSNFLGSISCGNPEFVSDVQAIFGYGITGETREPVFFLLYGTGSNGKTTLMEAIRNVMAPFVKTFPIEQLTSGNSSNGTRANPALAAASDARILFTSESNEKDFLNEGKVKSLTGGSMLTTRDLNKSNFEFIPNFKIFMDTNFFPKIRGLDFAIWRRIKVLKFQATFTPATVDVKLPEKLRSEHEKEAILSWLVAGAIRYYTYGLILSNDVSQATADYKNTCDTVGRFLDERVETKDGTFYPAQKLFTDYEVFCSENGLDPHTSTMFGRIMSSRGIHKKRQASGNVYLDICVKDLM